MSGRLFVCATPIGNLEDASYRLLRVLKEADLIAAEDTRRTRKLLTSYQIKARLVSYNKDNEPRQTAFLIDRLAEGKSVALVSDGGMPGISDPGFRIISACIEQGFDLEVIPGPSAVISALVLSGLPTARFCFEGFLPRKAGELRRRLQDLKAETRTMVFFESPRRVHEMLAALEEVLGDRRVALAREMTKLNEENLRGAISSVRAQMPAEVLGEIVVVVEGAPAPEGNLDSAVELARELIGSGLKKSEAAARAALEEGVNRRDVYARLV
ncbi:MAG: 16S rRNA (cytidine(1402)-2'-O)-methyltransferase [Actinomycetota bacterium]